MMVQQECGPKPASRMVERIITRSDASIEGKRPGASGPNSAASLVRAIPVLERQAAAGSSSCAQRYDYDPADFTRVLENFDQTTPLLLDGSKWDNTLVRNCRIHDTGGVGILISNGNAKQGIQITGHPFPD